MNEHEQAVLDLATMATKCPGAGRSPSGAGVWHGKGMCLCDGADPRELVPMFPTLRVECPCLGFLEHGSDGVNHWTDTGCKRCYIRGKHDDCYACRLKYPSEEQFDFIPVDDLQVLMDALRDGGWHWVGQDYKNWGVYKAVEGDHGHWDQTAGPLTMDKDLAIAARDALNAAEGEKA